MREIKFRAWDKEFNHWNKCAPVILPLHTDSSFTLKPATEDLILMQFTGLKDKNGKEIYEGDIVKRREVYIVVFDFCAWMLQRIGEPARFYLNRHPTTEWEVIGNIYENPELLGS